MSEQKVSNPSPQQNKEEIPKVRIGKDENGNYKIVHNQKEAGAGADDHVVPNKPGKQIHA
jgi:hypothetical protein